MSCRVEILVCIRSMQAQECRIDQLVEVDVQIESVAGHVSRKLLVVHVVGHDWLCEAAVDVVAEKGGGVAECLIGDC